MGKRVWQYPEATGITNDDVILLDSPTGGSRSIKANEIGSVLINKTLTERGTFDAADDNVDGYKKVTVDVPYTDVEVASGPVASWDDGEDLPLKSLTSFIDPQQDLHGYDSPWIGGSGKNKLNVNADMPSITGLSITKNTDGSIKINGSVSSLTWIPLTTSGTLFVNGTNYTLSGCPSGGGSDTYQLDIRTTNTIGSIYQSAVDRGDSISFVGTGETAYVGILIRPNVSVNTTFYPQIEIGTTASTYEPYSNICPISGWNEANVVRCGANLCDGIFEQGSIANNGTNQPSTTRCRLVGYMPIKPNATYYCKSDYNTFLFFYDENKTYIGYYANNVKKIRFKPKDLPNAVLGGDDFSNASFVRFRYDNATFEGNFSINYPSTDTEYHTYNGQTYTIDLGGTRYGGTLDVVSGVLTVDRVEVDLTQGMNGGTISGNYLYYKELNPLPKVISNSEPANVISEGYQKIRYNGVATTVGTIAIRTNNYIYVNTGGQDITPIGKAVYELATPTTIQLTPTQVKSLPGVNNIYSNTGDVDVEYQKLWVRPSA